MNGYSAEARDMFMDKDLDEHPEEQEGEDEELICINKDCVYQDEHSTYHCGAERKDGDPAFVDCRMRLIKEL